MHRSTASEMRRIGHPAPAVTQPLRSPSLCAVQCRASPLACPTEFTWPAAWPCLSYLKSICATSTISIGLPMSARIHFLLQHLQQLRFWPTDQANPYPYTREKKRIQRVNLIGWKSFYRVATWPLGQSPTYHSYLTAYPPENTSVLNAWLAVTCGNSQNTS